MKSLWGKLGFLFGIIGFIILSYVEGWGADWKLFTKTSNGSYLYYDTESITHLSRRVVRVWVKTIYSEKDLKWWRDGNDRLKTLGFTLYLEEHNCAVRTHRILSLTHYSVDKGVLLSEGQPSEPGFIFPGTVAETIHKIVCK